MKFKSYSLLFNIWKYSCCSSLGLKTHVFKFACYSIFYLLFHYILYIILIWDSGRSVRLDIEPIFLDIDRSLFDTNSSFCRFSKQFQQKQYITPSHLSILILIHLKLHRLSYLVFSHYFSS